MQSMKGSGLENPAARLFSQSAGDYGSMVNERVGAGNWDSGQELGDTWASRNAFSYGRCGPEDFSVNLPNSLGARRIARYTRTILLWAGSGLRRLPSMADAAQQECSYSPRSPLPEFRHAGSAPRPSACPLV